jgi:ABC-type anion transport system duplicated permease subunit
MPNIVYEKFTANYRYVLYTYRWLIVVFIIALICDGASTIYVMLNEGAENELHPVIKLVSAKILGPVFGPVAGVVGKAISGLIVAIYFKRFAPYIFIAAIIISFWAAWYNIWGWKLYIPIGLKWLFLLS